MSSSVIIVFLQNSKSPLRDTLSMTVEEKLKSLLDTPTPGGLVNGHQEVNSV